MGRIARILSRINIGKLVDFLSRAKEAQRKKYPEEPLNVNGCLRQVAA